MKPWEKYAAPVAADPAEDGPWAKYSQPEEAPQPTAQTLAVRKAEEDRKGGTFRQNLAAGIVRGAGSIGATIMTPIDAAARALGVDPNSEIGGWVGRTDRRDAMTGALQDAGANPDSLAFKGGKIGAEIAGTAGAGGALAKGLTAIPGAATAMPGVINALRTGGMTTGQAVAPGAMNVLRDLGTRAVGGAITGGASAGLVDPSQAGMGAAVGGALPIVLKGAGMAGNALGAAFRGPEVPQNVIQGAQAARAAGLVIPPTQVKPSLPNRLLEGFSGKITTAQNASARNQPILNDMVATELGLPAGQQVTPQALKTVRAQAGQAYDAVASTGTITPGPAYEAALDKITAPAKLAAAGFPGAKANPIIAEIESLKSPQFDAASAVEKIKDLRSQADAAYAQGNKQLGKAFKDASGVLEDAIDTHLSGLGVPPEMLQGFRDARQLIAKTYSAEKAMNPTSGNFDARKLASQLDKGKPLSGGIRAAAEFGQQFPKAAQTVERMGSLPQTSPLDWAMGGSLSAATANPLAMVGVMARPAARALTLSPMVQNRLVQQGGPNALAGLLSNSQLEQLGYQAAPVFAASGR